jgi:hypothetical protein
VSDSASNVDGKTDAGKLAGRSRCPRWLIASPGSVLPVLAGCVVLILSGLVHGMWSSRWQTVDDSPIVSRLADVPTRIGSWESISQATINDEFQRIAGLSAYVQRTYRDRLTGASVTMLLMCGEPGPVSVHPPEACYSGQGYEVVAGSRQTVEISLEEALAGSKVKPQFKSARFAKPGVIAPSQPQIFWAWSDDGHWRVPENTRFEFAGSPILCKLYVTWDAPLAGAGAGASQKGEGPMPPEEFLEVLVPQLFETVFREKGNRS